MNIQTQLKRNKRFGFPLLGFSLIELLVTITLLSVLLFIALPSFQQLISDTRLKVQISIFNVLATLLQSHLISNSVECYFEVFCDLI
jgi:prepilin-type N-terminal cleavage/methylation domain-containing protein